MKYPRKVLTTWDTTIQQLSPSGIALLRQLSWLAPEPIPRSLLPDGEAQDALAELAGFSLAKLDKSGTKFRIHGLIQDVTRERQTGRQREKSLRSALELMNHAGLKDPQDVRSWPIWEPLRPHVSAVTSHADKYGTHDPTSYLMNQLGLLLLAKASYREAESLMRRTLAIDEARYGPEHPEVAPDLNNLAWLLHATKRLEEAEPLMRRVLTIVLMFTRSTGHPHPKLEMAFGNYRLLLESMALDGIQISQRLHALGREAGFDEASYDRLIAELIQ